MYSKLIRINQINRRFSDIEKGIVVNIDGVSGSDHEFYRINPPLRLNKNDMANDVSDGSFWNGSWILSRFY